MTADKRPPLNDVKALRACADQLADVMKRYNTFPMRDYSSYGGAVSVANICFEITNLLRFYTGGNNMFNPSLCPSIYGRRKPDLYRYYEFFIKGIPFRQDDLPPLVAQHLDLLVAAGLVTTGGDACKAAYRLLEFDGMVFVTDLYSRDKDMVWLSADSLNTVRMIKRRFRDVEDSVEGIPRVSILDLCCGSGFVGCCVARMLGRDRSKLQGFDINPRAVEQATVNAELNGLNAEFVTASVYEHNYTECFDIIVANPAYGSSPYEAKRLCHDGGRSGIQQTLSVFNHILSNLAEGGRFFVMADSPVANGKSLLFSELSQMCAHAYQMTYEVLYSYRSSNMRIAAGDVDGPRIDRRERAFIHGRKAGNAGGQVQRVRNRTFGLANKF